MPKYRVTLVRVDDLSQEIEAISEDDAIDQAIAISDEAFLCAQCSGWGQDWDIGEGEWTLFDEVFPSMGIRGVEEVEE